MLILITGAPGAGKTQYCIQRYILEKQKEEKPRPIFSNIKGLRDCGPVGISPLDWRDTPDGSIVIYDEAQAEELFPATGMPGNSKDPRIARLDTHRHTGHDIVVMTQDATLLHHHLRKFVGRHIHLVRSDGAESSTVYQWNKYQPSVDDFHAKQGADVSYYRMDKSIWDKYDSATIHTHKFEMPKGAKWMVRMALGAMLVVGLMFAGFAYLQKREMTSPAPQAVVDTRTATPQRSDTALTEIPPSGAFDWRASPTVQPIAGCAASELRCRCWDNAGLLMDMSDATCRNLAEGHIPMPIDLFRSSGGEREGAQGSRQEPAPAASLL